MTRIGVLALEGGKWLAMPLGFHANVTPFNSRVTVLEASGVEGL
ncbi:MAG TPA: hypothetical protein VMM15_17930 [Bradyrhizobium sp.]|nr:hypothetical protein [Bradyrhizobium sp.]